MWLKANVLMDFLFERLSEYKEITAFRNDDDLVVICNLDGSPYTLCSGRRYSIER